MECQAYKIIRDIEAAKRYDEFLASTPEPPFEEHRVEAESVADFLDRYYKKARYRGRGEEYAAGLLASYEKDFRADGYVFISRNDSATGDVVAYFGKEQ